MLFYVHGLTKVHFDPTSLETLAVLLHIERTAPMHPLEAECRV